MKNMSFFLFENFQFWEVKLSIYLNRRVFVIKGFKLNWIKCGLLLNIDVVIVLNCSEKSVLPKLFLNLQIKSHKKFSSVRPSSRRLLKTLYLRH